MKPRASTPPSEQLSLADAPEIKVTTAPKKKSAVDDYSYEAAEAYIQSNLKDYTLIGFLPQKPVSSPWEIFPLIHFLFIKDNNYYSCSVRDLLKKEKMNPPEIKLAEGGYIYVKLREKDLGKYIFRLRKNTDLTGHERLAVGFKDFTGEAGGEIYFHQGKLALYNHKSSFYAFPKEKIVAAMDEVFSAEIKSVFYEEFDPVKILAEYEARKNKEEKKQATIFEEKLAEISTEEFPESNTLNAASGITLFSSTLKASEVIKAPSSPQAPCNGAASLPVLKSNQDNGKRNVENQAKAANIATNKKKIGRKVLILPKINLLFNDKSIIPVERSIGEAHGSSSKKAKYRGARS